MQAATSPAGAASPCSHALLVPTTTDAWTARICTFSSILSEIDPPGHPLVLDGEACFPAGPNLGRQRRRLAGRCSLPHIEAIALQRFAACSPQLTSGAACGLPPPAEESAMKYTKLGSSDLEVSIVCLVSGIHNDPSSANHLQLAWRARFGRPECRQVSLLAPSLQGLEGECRAP